MKKFRYLLIASFTAFIAFFTFVFGGGIAYADGNAIYLGGMTAGFSLQTRGAFVIGVSEVLTDKGLISPAKNAGIVVGDVIMSIDGQEVNDAEDVETTLNDEKEKTMLVKRAGETLFIGIIPARDTGGKYRLGIFIREGVNGIGTVTFIQGNRLASLGHSVSGQDGQALEIRGGNLYACDITGVVKGERGAPGELRGVFLKNKPLAIADKNLYCGVYGTLDENFNKADLREIETGIGKMGEASIFANVDGNEAQEYKISIIKASGYDSCDKNYVIKVTDKNLLEKTGGIVQGMSGSPIVQDGKLVGAVTHVFINDPTRGFGIAIENMLNN